MKGNTFTLYFLIDDLFFFPFAFEPELFLLFSAQYRSRWGKRFSIKISIGFFSLSRGNLVCCSSSESYLGGKCLLAFNWKWERNILYTPLTHNTVSSKLFYRLKMYFITDHVLLQKNKISFLVWDIVFGILFYKRLYDINQVSHYPNFFGFSYQIRISYSASIVSSKVTLVTRKEIDHNLIMTPTVPMGQMTLLLMMLLLL